MFPHAVCRIGGQPFDVLDDLASPATEAAAARLDRAEERLGTTRRRLEDALHQTVGTLAEDGDGVDGDAACRRPLLAAARNLRRRGKLSPAQEATVATHPGLAVALAGWIAASDAVETASFDLDERHAMDLGRSGRVLLERARDPAFLRGLAVASSALSARLEAADDPADSTRRTRSRRRLEQSLLKYLSRAAAKTSPFSTFTILAAVRFERSDPGVDPPPPAAHPLTLPDGEIVSVPSLNKALYALLTGDVLARRSLFGAFSVVANPSLRRAPNEPSTVLLARGGREELVTLAATPAVDMVLEMLASRGGICPHGDLVERLATRLGLSSEEVRPRVDRLIETGIVLLDSTIADHELAWAPVIRRLLESSSDSTARHAAEVLAELERWQQPFGVAAAHERRESLRLVRGRLETLLDELGVPRRTEYRTLVEKNPYYEDCVVRETARVDLDSLAPAFDSLAAWADWMTGGSMLWGHHASMRAWVDARRPAQNAIPFVELYRGFLDEVYAEVLRQERDDAPGNARSVNPFGQTTMREVFSAAASLRSLLEARWSEDPEATEIGFDRHDLATIRSAGHPAGLPTSINAFVQIVPGSELDQPETEAETPRLVVDQQAVHAGAGRYFSRFLHALDPEVTRALRRRIVDLGRSVDDAIVAELGDDGQFSFNANLHPPLTDAEINYPAGLTGLDPETNVDLADLEVRRDPERAWRLRLIHRPTGREVLPVDLGFVNPRRRPPLFRVLALFSPFAFHRIEFPPRLSGAVAEPGVDVTPADVVVRPRIVFEDRLILARRRWTVPTARLLSAVDGLSPGRAHRALRRLQADLGLPDDVYVAVPREDDAAPAGTSHKPQFLSFGSVLFGELLLEMARGSHRLLAFEEAWPARRHMATRGGRPHATELVVQLDREAR